MFGTDGLIVIGKITGTHGVRGQVLIIPYSGDADSIIALHSFFLRSKQGEYASYEIQRAVAHKKRVLVSLKNFDSINQVLPLVGNELYIHRDQLPHLPDDEYYWCDLIGLTVTTVDGTELGELVDIIETGSNDVYVVRSDVQEVLVPALEDVVKDVDLEAGRMVVSLPDGLLDL
jgi:16S rRNA processing protein RimM